LIRRLLLGILCAAAVGAPRSLAAQRGEISILGGFVQSPDVEFDRVLRGSNLGVPLYVRQRGERSAGPAFGVAATFAIRGHVFAELGVLHHGIERAISATGLGDETGPFLITNRYKGALTTFWVGPSYRFVDREWTALSAVLAPTVIVMAGEAYSNETVFHNFPSSNTTIGVLLGVRGRHWLNDRVGLQASLDDVMWTFPLAPHNADGTPFAPLSSRKTPRQHDLRLHLGLALRLR